MKYLAVMLKSATVKCKLKTLSSLCKWALEKIKPIQMVSVVKVLKNKEAETPSFIIRYHTIFLNLFGCLFPRTKYNLTLPYTYSVI